jgi:hypothetical protein
MGFFESLFTYAGTWFGYVGACVVAPDATCRPFLAFIALGAAASVALTLVLLAYRSASRRAAARVHEPIALGRRTHTLEHARRTGPEPQLAPQPALDGRLRVAA